MKHRLKILEIAKKNKGVVLTKQVTSEKIPRSTLNQMTKDGDLYQVQRGIYVTDYGYVDDYYLLQSRYPTGVYSHETALYLLGYSDRVPSMPIMTFRYGTSTTRMIGEVKPIIVSNEFDLGKIEIERNGSKVRLYNIERTLIDLIKPRYSQDMEQFLPALKQYVQDEKRDINKLFYYATHFGLEVELQKYIGGLL